MSSPCVPLAPLLLFCLQVDSFPNSDPCRNVSIVSRSTWGARPAIDITLEHLPVDLFFIHHTSEQSCTESDQCIKIVQGIQNYHIDDRGWWDIGYSFLVGEDGNIYEGRGWNRVGAHTYGFNSRSIALSFIGNFESRIPNDKALHAAKALLQCGVAKGYLNPSYRLYGHRDASQTDCPGTSLYKLINTWSHYSTIPLQKIN